MGRGAAFCPAHITGFFKSHPGGGNGNGGGGAWQDMEDVPPESVGSTGAGFSIRHGVTTRVRVTEGGGGGGGGGGGRAPNFRVASRGYQTDGKTDITERVLGGFMEIGGSSDRFFEIEHEISVPVGYGLGVSGAIALSLSLALDQAMHTGLPRNEIGQIAHNAEVGCKTGLGDVLASFHGGFEIRTRPGAPGIGSVEKIRMGGGEGAPTVAVACLAPIPTSAFIRERLSQINGLGGRMVGSLLQTRSCEHFQEMSLRFARHAGVVTPRMQGLIDRLSRSRIGCGVALFGETVFTMIPDGDGMEKALGILRGHPGGTVIVSELDEAGARVLGGAQAASGTG